MKMQFNAMLLLGIVIVQGCSSTITEKSNFDQSQAYLDHEFETSAEIISSESIFYLSPEMKRYVNKRLKPEVGLENKAKTLLMDLFSEQQMNIIYDQGANSIPAETFKGGSANCMSLTLLSYVLAKEAGIRTSFMSVDVEENWNVSAQFTQLNGHVNLEIRDVQFNHEVATLASDAFVIDFLPMLSTKVDTKQQLNKSQITALFYNNKGAEALYIGDVNLAYQYFKQATVFAPKMASLWGNLAGLYRQSGFLDKAEYLYLHARYLDPRNLNVQENLALLYRKTDREHLAQDLYKKVEQQRKNNPFYFAMLGEQALLENRTEQAISYFRRAIKLERKEHSFYFGLAKSFAKLNDLPQAQRYLNKAKRVAVDSHQKQTYQNKISALNQSYAKVSI